MSDIFISYAREDFAIAQALADTFESKGLSVWWDHELHAGDHFTEVVEEKLATVRCVLVLWSVHSVGSRWVLAEANEGLKRGILVPVAIDKSQPPLLYRAVQTADLIGWKGGQQTPTIKKLVKDILTLVRDNSDVSQIDANGSFEEQKFIVPFKKLGFVFVITIVIGVIWFGYSNLEESSLTPGKYSCFVGSRIMSDCVINSGQSNNLQLRFSTPEHGTAGFEDTYSGQISRQDDTCYQIRLKNTFAWERPRREGSTYSEALICQTEDDKWIGTWSDEDGLERLIELHKEP